MTLRRFAFLTAVAALAAGTALAPPGPGGKGRIGVSHSMAPGAGVVFVRSNPAVALWEGALKTWEWTYLTVKGMYKLVTV